MAFDLACVGENMGHGGNDKGVGLVGDSWSRVSARVWVGPSDSTGMSFGRGDEGEGWCSANRAGRKRIWG